jgi:hypothetical protein
LLAANCSMWNILIRRFVENTCCIVQGILTRDTPCTLWINFLWYIFILNSVPCCLTVPFNYMFRE